MLGLYGTQLVIIVLYIKLTSHEKTSLSALQEVIYLSITRRFWVAEVVFDLSQKDICNLMRREPTESFYAY